MVIVPETFVGRPRNDTRSWEPGFSFVFRVLCYIGPMGQRQKKGNTHQCFKHVRQIQLVMEGKLNQMVFVSKSQSMSRLVVIILGTNVLHT